MILSHALNDIKLKQNPCQCMISLHSKAHMQCHVFPVHSAQPVVCGFST